MTAKKSKKPSKAEVAKLRRALNEVTREFWSSYGGSFDIMMVGPPGPRPPPRLEVKVINLSSY